MVHKYVIVRFVFKNLNKVSKQILLFLLQS